MGTPHHRLSELFLLAVANGHVDPLEDPEIAARLAILRGRYGHIDRMAKLLGDACETLEEAVVCAEVAADRAYLEGLIDGRGDLLSDETFPKLEPMFARYAEGSAMHVLLERAATVFGHAVQEVAASALASWVIHNGRRRARDEDVDE